MTAHYVVIVRGDCNPQYQLRAQYAHGCSWWQLRGQLSRSAHQTREGQ
ncbi:hypothetical protein GP658_20505 [Enterobacteriaceae bacterium TzEc013]|nr:hypothetical protein [Enterobacteriaceae bacterium TzEc013]